MAGRRSSITDDEGIIRRIENQRSRQSPSPSPPIETEDQASEYTQTSRTGSSYVGEELSMVRSVSPGSARYHSFSDWDRIMNLETGIPNKNVGTPTPNISLRIHPVPKLRLGTERWPPFENTARSLHRDHTTKEPVVVTKKLRLVATQTKLHGPTRNLTKIEESLRENTDVADSYIRKLLL